MTTLNIDGLQALLERLGLKVPIPSFTDADILDKPLDIARSYLADILVTLAESEPANTYKSISWPGDIFNGDLAVILPKLKHGVNANTLSFELMQKFPPCPLFILPFAEGVHLRIMFQSQTLFRLIVPYILDRATLYGSIAGPTPSTDPETPSLRKKKLVIEFSSPNLASEFFPRHLRSTILGSYISTLHSTMGWDVTKLNYLGDWGKPLGLLGVAWEEFGSEEKYAEDPVAHLADIYAKINEQFIPESAASKKARDDGHSEESAEIEKKGVFAKRNIFFKRMEDREEKAMEFWSKVRELNVENYKKLYKRLGIEFDVYDGESQVPSKTMVEVEELLKEKGITEESEGSWMIDFKKHPGVNGGKKVTGVGIVRDRTGSSTYLLRDIAAVLERERTYGFDRLIYVVAADQHVVHFSRLIKILELLGMGDTAAKIMHVSFGEMKLDAGEVEIHDKHGGNLLSEILDTSIPAIKKSLEAEPEKAALVCGGDTANGEKETSLVVNSLLIHILSNRRPNDHPQSISIERMTAFDPGTALDLQYWHSRLCLELGKAQNSSADDKDIPEEDYASFNTEDEEKSNLVRWLVQYPDIIATAFKGLESAGVVAYLMNIAAQLQVCLEAGAEIEEAAQSAQSAEGITKGVTEGARGVAGGTDSIEVAKPAPPVELAESITKSAEGADVEVVELDEGVQGIEIEANDTGRTLSASDRLLYAATRVVLENGMRLLGLSVTLAA